MSRIFTRRRLSVPRLVGRPGGPLCDATRCRPIQPLRHRRLPHWTRLRGAGLPLPKPDRLRDACGVRRDPGAHDPPADLRERRRVPLLRRNTVRVGLRILRGVPGRARGCSVRSRLSRVWWPVQHVLGCLGATSHRSVHGDRPLVYRCSHLSGAQARLRVCPAAESGRAGTPGARSVRANRALRRHQQCPSRSFSMSVLTPCVTPASCQLGRFDGPIEAAKLT